MRIVFLGTPAFAVASLDALLAGADEVATVVTQPERPRGRGLEVAPSPVARRAAEAGIPVLQPERLHTPEILDLLRTLAPDLLVTCAFGRILRPSLLEVPLHGCLNVHASLLPRHRGASPIPRAILESDAWTGITIFRLEAGMDTGPILLQRMERILPEDTSGSLGERLALLGGEALREACDRIRSGQARYSPQAEQGVSYAPLLAKADGALAWNRPADQIDRFVRAMDPWPGASTSFRGQAVRLLAAAPLDLLPREEPPGSIVALDPSPVVAALPGRVRLMRMQAAGRRAIAAEEWARGTRPRIGERFA